jgi:hypothetical protein
MLTWFETFDVNNLNVNSPNDFLNFNLFTTAIDFNSVLGWVRLKVRWISTRRRRNCGSGWIWRESSDLEGNGTHLTPCIVIRWQEGHCTSATRPLHRVYRCSGHRALRTLSTVRMAHPRYPTTTQQCSATTSFLSVTGTISSADTSPVQSSVNHLRISCAWTQLIFIAVQPL